MNPLLIFLLFLGFTAGDDVIDATKGQAKLGNEKTTPLPEIEDSAGPEVANAIEKIELIAASAEKSRREGILPEEHSEELYDVMVDSLVDLIEIVKNPQNTYRFLNKKGVDRIITPIIGINYDPLKKQFLLLIKTLFKVTPTTTKALMPASVVDKLLDIFVNDDNLSLKAHAVDIMDVWLPENPKLQARVMRLQGLEPFYHQVSKLDNSVVETLLGLFNKILSEHVNARSNRAQKTKGDFEELRLYEMIGLIERMSTPTVCYGLLNIIEAFSPLDEDQPFPLTIFELLKNIKPFCLNTYRGRAQAIKVFGDLANFISNRKESFRNLTDFRILLEDYVKYIRVKDEF
ncbi:uncharacterized protein LOC116774808 [Danaus plexippus]|uniref:uncharacterized protein LOC116774808 n=1 Tax=Danaus plexippus TaxID=13037 RepID=UPI002AAFB964|nr:uncharacterized protein LOC116774808 [Danaus plexippus]